MEYRGYTVSEEGNGVVVGNVRDFDPVQVFECGQCFRWIRQEDGSYTGIIRDKVVNVSLSGDRLFIANASVRDFTELWFDYFDLGTDYSEIKRKLSARDGIMAEAVGYGPGIRLLKQDIWETLISFIISANNRIPMIMRTVDRMSRAFGKELTYEGKSWFTFPDAASLSDSCIEELEECKAGFRCKYIHKTANMVKCKVIELDKLKEMNTGEARSLLTGFPGVGNKVADCTLLYSGTKLDVFPTDVWIKRVVEELYFKRKAGFAEIQHFAGEYFGELAGIAQQYLFFYAREKRIGTA